jgi:hypothetical protein
MLWVSTATSGSRSVRVPNRRVRSVSSRVVCSRMELIPGARRKLGNAVSWRGLSDPRSTASTRAWAARRSLSSATNWSRTAWIASNPLLPASSGSNTPDASWSRRSASSATASCREAVSAWAAMNSWRRAFTPRSTVRRSSRYASIAALGTAAAVSESGPLYRSLTTSPPSFSTVRPSVARVIASSRSSKRTRNSAGSTPAASLTAPTPATGPGRPGVTRVTESPLVAW